ncbi:unnamed protein product [Cylicostephanus goldi]|uniref:Uncharacterized protein n=1 Tax=Cylicostephanus goldi TaxID=71465 RepID=A0A3P6RN18_CYLGO|nr:unnamed protein product [Cylicostephanus goldi]
MLRSNRVGNEDIASVEDGFEQHICFAGDGVEQQPSFAGGGVEQHPTSACHRMGSVFNVLLMMLHHTSAEHHYLQKYKCFLHNFAADDFIYQHRLPTMSKFNSLPWMETTTLNYH